MVRGKLGWGRGVWFAIFGDQGKGVPFRESEKRGGVFLEAQTPEGQVRFCSHEPQGLCDVCGFKEAKQADDEVSQRGDELRGVLSSDLAAVLIEGDIADIVEAVFNSPVSAVQLKETLGVSLFWREAGDPGDGFLSSFLVLQMKNLAADRENLADIWELKVVV